MPRRCNGCYSYDTKLHSKRWLTCLRFPAAVVVVVVGTIVLVLCFAIKPLQVKAEVESARLNNFTLASSLAYDLSICLTLRNPNGASVRYTKPLVAALFFHDRLLCNVTFMDEGSTHPLRKKVLQLRHPIGSVPPYVLADDAAAKDFKKQNTTGVFKLEIRLSGEIAFSFAGLHRIGKKRQLALSCPLTLQLAPPGPVFILFRRVSCKLGKP